MRHSTFSVSSAMRISDCGSLASTYSALSSGATAMASAEEATARRRLKLSRSTSISCTVPLDGLSA